MDQSAVDDPAPSRSVRRETLAELYDAYPTLSLLIVLEVLAIGGAYAVSALGFYTVAGILGAYAVVVPIFLLFVLLYLRVLPIIAS